MPSRHSKISTTLVFRKISGVLDWIDYIDGHPGQPGPQLSRSGRAYLIATAVRDVSAKLSDPARGQALHQAAATVAGRATQGMAAGWEEGDDLCPPWFTGRFPKPHPDPDPDPYPWREMGIALGPSPEPWLEAMPAKLLDAVLMYGVAELARRLDDPAFTQEIGRMNGVSQG